MDDIAAITSGIEELENQEETEALLLTIDDLNLNETAMIGFEAGGIALITSIAILGIVSIIRRVST